MHNTGINPSFPDAPVSHKFQQHLDALNRLAHGPVEASRLAEFDAEMEQLLRARYGESSPQLEAYKYATVAEAETIVNLPESAQEESTQDLYQKSLQQRRQVLEGCLSELRDVEAKEEQALTGEDHEDPPMMS